LIYDLLAPLMFIGLVVFLLLGYPVAFALGATGLAFAALGISQGLLEPALLQAVPQRLFGIMQNSVLMAIPFFTLMGVILERSGMAEDLLDTVGQLFGPLRGGIAVAVILVGALLAATTGVVAASVIAMGLISLPVMMRYGYHLPTACGVICASGSLAQILPPAIVLVVLGEVLGVSVGDLFAGAVVPGLLLVGMLLLYVGALAVLRPHWLPALPEAVRIRRSWDLWRYAGVAMLPPLMLILLVLGSIFTGVATPTEAGALGASGALLLAVSRRRVTRALLTDALAQTAKLTSFVMFVLIGSTVFALVFRAVNGDVWVEGLFEWVPGGTLGFLLVVNLLVFLLGFFLDFFEIAFILLPLIAPVAQNLGIDLVWLGVLLAVNLQTSFLTPPFGFALFYLRSVVPPTVTTAQIYRGVIPFIVVQIVTLALLIAFPGLITMDEPLTESATTFELPNAIPLENSTENALDAALRKAIEESR
jgi:tripartite ATP-independent transporter DctM subunit